MTRSSLALSVLLLFLSACSGSDSNPGRSQPQPQNPGGETNGETSPCPVNYVLVSKNIGLGVNGDFCVMAFEARAQDKTTSQLHPQGCSGDCTTKNWALSDPGSVYDADTNDLAYRPVSSGEGRPWRSIDLATAKAACSSLGAGYALISNQEWLSLAHAIEQVPANWEGDIVGQGRLSKGYTANPTLYHADGPAASSTGSCLYSRNDNTCGASGDAVDRRTLRLKADSDEVIWDLAGNVWEWVDWTIANPAKKASANTSTGWVEFSQLNQNIDETSEMPPATWSPFDPSLGSANGLGRYRRSGNTQNAAYRGGRWDSGVNGGLYSLYMDGATAGNYSLGFRCVYHLE